MKKILLSVLLFSVFFIIGCGNPYKINNHPEAGSQEALDRAYLECSYEADLSTTNLKGGARGFENALLIRKCMKLKGVIK